MERDREGILMKTVLNVGGNNKEIPIPPYYDGWEHHLLDIDPRGSPDVVCDARELTRLEPGRYDAVYCSHNLEHYYAHDVPRVLAGFRHVLKDEGFADIRVPDLRQVMQIVVEHDVDIDDVLYESAAGPITVKDVLYGYGVEIERSGQDFFAHKTGFSPKSLSQTLLRSGFRHAFVAANTDAIEVVAYAFKADLTEELRKLLGLPDETP
jgi:hypothetical protein